jgi:3-(3-hydroxy-phenyl)propionate hydroxylase
MAGEVPGVAFGYERFADQAAARPVRHAVVVVGAGPVGLAAAIDLARRGVGVVLLDQDDRLSEGSRAICFAKRTLEIFDRLGCGEGVAGRGVGWNTGRVFFGDRELYRFDLLEEAGHHRPAFVNIQQYHVEAALLQRAHALGGIDVRWQHRVSEVVQDDDGVTVTVMTPEGEYRLCCDWLIAADGSRSTVRTKLGHASTGQVFRDRFLIADVRMQAPFPAERWFWFDPPFHRGGSVLLHRQPDDVWRIDFQLGWDADPVAERAPERVIPRVRALLGADVPFELVWVSVYTFACQRMAQFRDRRVLFAGDAAHGVSPFGARGANSGVQDADNLAWKLALVLRGEAPAALLDSYCEEREAAADENIRASTRSTDFITPKSEISRIFRDAVLELAADCPFARPLVNSGRLSVPTRYVASALNTPDADAFAAAMAPGGPAADAPVRVAGVAGWFLEHVGDAFTLVCFGPAPTVPDLKLPLRRVLVQTQAAPAPAGWDVVEEDGMLSARYDARPGTVYLLRPDQHVAARWRAFDAARLDAALRRATAWGRTC